MQLLEWKQIRLIEAKILSSSNQLALTAGISEIILPCIRTSSFKGEAQ